MSLISSPRHTVTVIIRKEVRDDEGAIDFVEVSRRQVRCNVHPSSVTEQERFGTMPHDLYTLITAPGSWPGDPLSLIEWDGDIYQQRGRVQKSRMGRSTKHDKIFMERGNGTSI